MPPVYKVLIIGGGVIGLSLARQLRRRSMAVTVSDPAFAHDPHQPGPGASYAAAGMLAVNDPHNPPQLLPLSRLSRSLYNDFLADVEELSGQTVPFQTQRTLQTLPDGSVLELSEQSLDPRQLTPALRSAVERLGATLTPDPPSVGDEAFDAVVYTAGAWTPASFGFGHQDQPNLPVTPRKGQMLRVLAPGDLREVYRSEHVYIVPRLFGPAAGTALIGATVENAGFDRTIVPGALQNLRYLAAELVPSLADEQLTPALESWAGFRPATPDGLPLLGELAPASPQAAGAKDQRRLIATGHYRNGILLAPATAVLLANLLEDVPAPPALQTSLESFRPGRFAQP